MADKDKKVTGEAATPEQQIAALQKDFQTLTQQNKELNNTVAEVVRANEDLARENQNLMKAMETKNSEIMAGVLQQLGKTNEIKTNKPSKPVVPAETFTVGEKTYKFRLAQFTLKRKNSTAGEMITAKDALTDEAILAQLVEMGSNVIKEVV